MGSPAASARRRGRRAARSRRRCPSRSTRFSVSATGIAGKCALALLDRSDRAVDQCRRSTNGRTRVVDQHHGRAHRSRSASQRQPASIPAASRRRGRRRSLCGIETVRRCAEEFVVVGMDDNDDPCRCADARGKPPACAPRHGRPPIDRYCFGPSTDAPARSPRPAATMTTAALCTAHMHRADLHADRRIVAPAA